MSDFSPFLNQKVTVDCVNPVTIDLDHKYWPKKYVYVPCGKCYLCKKRRQKDWQLRLQLHMDSAVFPSFFVTLTYDESFVPKDLNYKDFKDFYRRISRGLQHFKYFVCGEYGSNTSRPHFHFAAFHILQPRLFKYYVDNYWGKGFVAVEPLNEFRCKYLCGYIAKKFIKNNDINHSVPSFVHMSPGLAEDYLFINNARIKDNYCISYKGNRYPILDYFLKKLKVQDSEWYKRYICFLAEHSKEEIDRLYAEYDKQSVILGVEKIEDDPFEESNFEDWLQSKKEQKVIDSLKLLQLKEASNINNNIRRF